MQSEIAGIYRAVDLGALLTRYLFTEGIYTNLCIYARGARLAHMSK